MDWDEDDSNTYDYTEERFSDFLSESLPEFDVDNREIKTDNLSQAAAILQAITELLGEFAEAFVDAKKKKAESANSEDPALTQT
ncbi:MAG: hypothetical protein ABSA96_05115 [Candidatus Acidiferrales bacterium]|jgi:hypothetical protein